MGMVEYAPVLSRKSKYGLKALLLLAREAGRGPVLISELADRDAIPKKFLEAILLDLLSSESGRPATAYRETAFWHGQDAIVVRG